MRGTTPRPYAANVAPAPLLFLFQKKKRRGRKEKALTHRRAGKEHVESRKPYQLEIALAPKGAIVRNSAYLLRSVSFSRATSALTRVVCLGAHPSCTIQHGLPALRRGALSIEKGGSQPPWLSCVAAL